MKDNEIKRLNLKSRSLSEELASIERQALSIGSQLKQAKNEIQGMQSSWSACLEKALKSYKSSPIQTHLQVLQSKMKTISEFKQLMSEKKKEESRLMVSFGNLLCSSKQKNHQLKVCQSKAKALKNLIEDNRAQTIQDESNLISHVCKHKELQETDRQLSAGQKNDESDPRSSDSIQVDCGLVALISNESQSHLTGSVIQNPLNQEQQGLSLQNFNETRCHNQLLSDSNQKWHEARSHQDLRDKSNQSIQILHVKDLKGDHIFLDYQIQAGRSVSIEASRAAKSNCIGLELKASSLNDKMKLIESKEKILKNLSLNQIKISKLNLS